MEERIERWKRLLDIEEIQELKIETERDTTFQRNIRKDAQRTRTNQVSSEEKEKLETMLTYYCKEQLITYKQGMNELLIPFVYMGREGVPDHVLYHLFKGFIKTVCPTMFVDEVTFM